MKRRSNTAVPFFITALAALGCLIILPVSVTGGGVAEAVQRGDSATEAPDAQVPLGPVTGSVARGRELYYQHSCYGCHGFNGETGARDLVGTNSPILADENRFLEFLRLRGDQAPLLPSTRMPNYPESALSNDDARDIYAFIRSFRLNAPDVADVPALNAIIESASKPFEP